MLKGKPNVKQVLKAFNNFIEKVGQERIDKNEYFTNYLKDKR